MLLLRPPSSLDFKVTEIARERISFKESALSGCSLWALCWLLHNLESKAFLCLLASPTVCSWGLLLSYLVLVYSFKTLVGPKKKKNVQFQSFMGLKNNSLPLYWKWQLPHIWSHGILNRNLIKIPFLAKGMEGKLKSGPDSWCWRFLAIQHRMTLAAFGEPSNLIRQACMSPASVSAMTQACGPRPAYDPALADKE